MFKKDEGYYNFLEEMDSNSSPELGNYMDTTEFNSVTVLSDLTVSLTVSSDPSYVWEQEPADNAGRADEPMVIQEVVTVQSNNEDEVVNVMEASKVEPRDKEPELFHAEFLQKHKSLRMPKSTRMPG